MDFKGFAIRNVGRNMKAYFAYFLSSTISASLMFSISMLIFHPDFNTSELEPSLKIALYLANSIAYIFLILFVFYSVSVFLKSRFKEFGILYIVGASKKQIRKLIFIENIIISLSSSLSSIVIGLILSKIFLVISSSFIGIEALKFYIPFKAMIITVGAFLLIGIIVSIATFRVIKENEVIKLLKGSQKPKEEPKSSQILASLSVIFIGISYIIALNTKEDNVMYILVPVAVLSIVGTYLLFSQLSIFIIKVLKSKEGFYRNRTNILWISNLLYKIKDNIRIFFLIAITSTIAFISIGAVYAFWVDIDNQMEVTFPQDFYYATKAKDWDEIDNKRVDLIESCIKESNLNYFKVEGRIKNELSKEGDLKVNYISESTYNYLCNKYKINKIDFKDGEALGLGKEKLNLDINLNIVKNEVSPIIPKIYTKTIVVKDNYYNDLKLKENKFYGFKTEDYKLTSEVNKKIFGNIERKSMANEYVILSKIEMLETAQVIYGTLTFLAIFIGIIFFVTTSSFLYNKIYMEIEGDKNKYKQLNKLGLTFKEIKKVATIEIGVLFLLPYVIAIIHAMTALLAYNRTFSVPVQSVGFLVMGSFLFIQVIYFIIIRSKYLREIKLKLI
ncbi:MAG: FtsX-like permease family protein [Clostridium sp.]